MDFSVILPFVQAIVTATLLSLVLRHPKQTTQTRWFSLFLLAMSVWGLAIGIMRSSQPVAAVNWEKLGLLMIAATVMAFFYFTLSYLRSHSRLLTLLPALYFLITLVMMPTSMLVEGVGVDKYGNAPEWNIIFYPWLAIIYLFIVGAIVNLSRARKESNSYEAKNRYLYLIAGTSLCFIGGLFDILPALGVDIYPSSIITNIGFALLTAVAILQYHLLDIRIVVRKSVAYILTSMIVAAPYVAVIILFNQYLQQHMPNTIQILLLIALALVLQIVWQRVQRTVDRWFYREQYDFLRELEKFSMETHDISSLPGLGSSFIGLISRAFRTSNIQLLLLNESGDYKTVASIGAYSEQIVFHRRSSLIQWFNKSNKILYRTYLDLDPTLQSITSHERADITGIGTEIFVPLKTNKAELVGLLLLGPKRSEQLYSEEDIRRINTVTSRMSVELENARLYAQETSMRRELQRLDGQKTEFLHHVAHELKTPLTAIISSSELMTADDIADIPVEQRERLLNNINRSAWLMDRKVGELLDLARIQIGRLDLKFEPVIVSEIVEDIVSQLSSLFKNKEQSIESYIPTGLPHVRADRERTLEVLLNLLSNANKFSPAGGHITISASEKDGFVLLEVKDCAPIIKDVDRMRIFEAYYRGGNEEEQQRVSGLGLGLAISKSLVELQKGEIGVLSEGLGNTFYFTIPVWKE